MATVIQGTTGTSIGGASSTEGNFSAGGATPVWDERLTSRTSSNTVVGGLYSSSTSYTSSVIRCQTETAPSTNWKALDIKTIGGAALSSIYGDGGYKQEYPATFGYGTGSGGTVTQTTNKSTAVTLNKPTGQITMNNAALGAGASVSFIVNNSLLTASDTVVVTPSNNANYSSVCIAAVAGAFYVRVTNLTAGSLNDALALNFAVIKGATS